MAEIEPFQFKRLSKVITDPKEIEKIKRKNRKHLVIETLIQAAKNTDLNKTSATNLALDIIATLEYIDEYYKDDD